MLILTTFVFALALFTIANNFRRHPTKDFALMPNCLMTRSPFVFITGLRSPFYFRNYWNRIPLYLREHGYEVLELDLPWRGGNERCIDLTHFLEAAKKENLCFHFIFDSSSATEAEWLKSRNSSVVQSLTVATSEVLGLQPATVGSLGFANTLVVFCHKLYLPKNLVFSPVVLGLGSIVPDLTVEKEFLRLAISLAEKEMNLADNVTYEFHQ
jgi:hypothetical protein